MKQYLDLTSWILLFFFAPFTVLILLSQNSIPGDFFYPVKRGLENIILAAASVSPTTKVAFRTGLTQTRFTEAQQLFVSKADTTAFTDFVTEVSSTQKELSTVSNSQDKIQGADKAIAKIEEYQTQLTQLQTQVQVAQALPQDQFQNPVAPVVLSQNPVAQPTNPPTSTNPLTSAQPSQTTQPTSTSRPNQPVQGSQPLITPLPTAVPANAPTPQRLAPAVTNVIANNPQKAEQVKEKLKDTKENLEKIKEKVKKQKEDAQVEEKVKEEQHQLREQIKKQEGENKDKANEPTASPSNH